MLTCPGSLPLPGYFPSALAHHHACSTSCCVPALLHREKASSEKPSRDKEQRDHDKRKRSREPEATPEDREAAAQKQKIDEQVGAALATCT